jgi:hypothetical protein
MNEPIDTVLWSHLGEDLALLLAEDRLPAPPIVPSFARETARPPSKQVDCADIIVES